MKKYNPNLSLFSLHIPRTAGTSLSKVLENWFSNDFSFDANNHPGLFKIIYKSKIDILIQRILLSGYWRHYKNHMFNVPPRKIPLDKKFGIFFNKTIPQCIHGHFNKQVDGKSLFEYYPNAQQFITFLRDPLQTHISLYNYKKDRIDKKIAYHNGKKLESELPFQLSIDEWLIRYPSNMLKYIPIKITLDNYKDIIEKYFVHIGIIEHFQNSIDILAQKLGFKAIRVPRTNLSSQSIQPSKTAIDKFKENNDLIYRIYDYCVELNL